MFEQVNKLISEGYSVKSACEALNLSRSTYYFWRKRSSEKVEPDTDNTVLDAIKGIKAEHPFWGYRRVHAWLTRRMNITVSQRIVRKIMRTHGLGANLTVKKAKRKFERSKPRAERPNQYWGIDMTKFIVQNMGNVYLIVVLDWFTKKIVGYNLSTSAKTDEWLVALDNAVNEEFPEGIEGQNLKLISDNGSQPTSRKFINAMTSLTIEQIFTSYNNPRGNAETERVIRTTKEEIIWLNEFDSFTEAKQNLSDWIDTSYNKLYVHSCLGYLSPEEFIANYKLLNKVAA